MENVQLVINILIGFVFFGLLLPMVKSIINSVK